MKKKFYLLVFVLTLGLTIQNSFAQAPPPDAHGSTEDEPGGSAPIAGGLTYLVFLAAAYGSRKWAMQNKEEVL
ncbi:MAG: hypothetical protein JW729_00815 [Bacteroidales bacterium]|nr:hypothetical protein [Bacteroidales bacterium]